MAVYTLAVGASEQHIHEADTYTELMSGAADLILQGKRVQLHRDRPVSIPANELHMIINTGQEEAACKCHCG